MVEKAYKYRSYPNKKQREQIAKAFGRSRFVYNYYLDARIQAYEKDKAALNYYDGANDLKHLKSKYR